MAWDWQPIETAPAGKLILITIAKGSLQCPVRGDRYVAMAVRKPATGTFTLFGQGAIREDECVTHWIVPELPPEIPPGPEMDLTPYYKLNYGEVPVDADVTQAAHVSVAADTGRFE